MSWGLVGLVVGLRLAESFRALRLGLAGLGFRGRVLPALAGLGEDESELESTTYRPRVRVHVMTIERTTTGINKAGDAGRMDAQIGSADALQRVFPTALSSYLPFRNSSELVR